MKFVSLSPFRYQSLLRILGYACFSFAAFQFSLLAAHASSLTLSAVGTTVVVSDAEQATWFQVSSSLGFPSNRGLSEGISPDVCPWNFFLCDFSLPVSTRFSAHASSGSMPSEAGIRSFLEKLNDRVSISPVDAVFTVNEEGMVSAFSPSRNGTAIDIEASLALLKKEVVLSSKRSSQTPLRLPTISTPPRITSTDAAKLGIVNFLGEGRTDFAGSPQNRIFNIKRALSEFQGVLIAPGEEFSFVQTLGEVDGEHGYLPELVIKRGRTEPEFGGGICQVSTTLFRAALNTGQKITERKNHAYPVRYYKPYGMDATIYIPKPDFKFKNTTPAHILIQGSVENTELIFRFYGTQDGRSISIDGPHILEKSADGSMKTSFTQIVTDQNGLVTLRDEFKSAYDSPSKYPHPGEETFTEKPRNWSEKEWREYQRTRIIPR